MTEIEIVNTPKLRKVREEIMYPGGNPLEIYQFDNDPDLWLVGSPFFEELGYKPGRQGVNNFLRDKGAMLGGRVMRHQIDYAGQKREMILLHEDAINIVFMYSKSSIAEKMQLEFARVQREIRQTGASFRPDIEEKIGDQIITPEDLLDPLKRGLLVIKQLEAFYEQQLQMREEQKTMQGEIKEIKDGVEETTKKLEAVAKNIPPPTIRFHREKKPTLLSTIVNEIVSIILKKYPDYRSPVANASAKDPRSMARHFVWGIFKPQFDLTEYKDLLVDDWNKALDLLYGIRARIISEELDPQKWITPEELHILCMGERRNYDLTDYTNVEANT